jgi:hypothetical protein
MVTRIFFNVAIRQWHFYLTHNILYPCFLHILLFFMPIAIMFLTPLPPPLAFLLPPLMGFLLFVRPMLFGLHHIFKLVTHTRHHLDHFHFLNVQYPILTLYSTFIAFIYLWSTTRYRCKSFEVLVAIFTFSILHLQWNFFVSTMPLYHYIQLFKMLVSIL